nr:hypothetical protein [uncultured Butyrivibrio sp.]
MYDFEYKELADYKGYGITRAHQVDDEGKKLKGTAVYIVSEGDDYIGEEYKNLNAAKKFIDSL